MVYFELSPRVDRLVTRISTPLIYGLILPPTAIYHSLRYLLLGPPFPGWTFHHYIYINIRRVVSQYTSFHRVAQRDPEAGTFPVDAAKYTADCDIAQVECPSIRQDVPCIGVVNVVRNIVKPVAVPGWMIREKGGAGDLFAPANENERVIFFIIGGGYSGGHPLRIHTAWSIAKITGARVFCVNYRKSLSASTAFPASLIDCLAGYQYLMDLGVAPKNIMLCGDSAGANASMALARYLGEIQEQGSLKAWGQVGAMCLHSPWSDFTSSFPSISRNKYNDHLIDLDQVMIPSHTRHFDRSSPYFSPALPLEHRFDHLVRNGTKVFISGGTAETFFDEIVALKKGMEGEGVDVRYRELEGATHSEFVWKDRTELASMGWSWKILAKDFEEFWEATA